MNFIAKREVKPANEESGEERLMEPIFVMFETNTDKIGRETINKVITTMQKYNSEENITDFLNAILVVKGITPTAKKVRSNLASTK